MSSSSFFIDKGFGRLFSLLGSAKGSIDIVSFQFTSRKLAQELVKKLRAGCRVRILTLPSDSFREPAKRKDVEELYGSVREAGGLVEISKWEIGDPSLTSTSLSGRLQEGGGNKWYSLHSKFFVADNLAVMTSANMTDAEEYECFLTFSASKTVSQFREAFEKLRELLVKDSAGFPGSLFANLPEQEQDLVREQFRRGRLVIRDYPASLIAKPDAFRDGIYHMPFDGTARGLLDQIITGAESFLYLSSERFFDDEAADALVSKVISAGIGLRILTGPPERIRQNPQKARSRIIDLVASGVNVAFLSDIHAKFWVSDKVLVVGSANIGLMNLGRKGSGGKWRANTETMYVTSDIDLVKQAKLEFEQLFVKARPAIEAISLSSAMVSEAAKAFELFKKQSDKEARETLARIRAKLDINLRKDFYRIAEMAVTLCDSLGSRKVTSSLVVMSAILFYLQQRQQDLDGLFERLGDIADRRQIESAVGSLLSKGFVEKREGYYVISVKPLVKDENESGQAPSPPSLDDFK